MRVFLVAILVLALGAVGLASGMKTQPCNISSYGDVFVSTGAGHNVGYWPTSASGKIGAWQKYPDGVYMKSAAAFSYKCDFINGEVDSPYCPADSVYGAIYEAYVIGQLDSIYTATSDTIWCRYFFLD